MKFSALTINGAFCIESEALADERGFFARVFCQNEFQKMGLAHEIRQTSLSFNKTAGTVRGMHYQKAPAEEAKIITCAQGSLFDVLLDLRHGSPTFGQWTGVTLEAKSGVMVYVPKGCAHGFQTLEDDTAVYYQMFEFFNPALAAGVRYDDKRFGIRWPSPVAVISDKDRSYPDFQPEAALR